MKSISLNIRKKVFFASLFFVMFTSVASAQLDEEPPVFDEDVNDEPAAPIDAYLFAGLIAGSFLAIRKLKKSEIA